MTKMCYKSVLFLFYCLAQVTSFSQANIDSLVGLNSIYYSKGNSIPFNGKVEKYFKNSKQRSLTGELVKGKKNGKWIYWNRDGSKNGYDNFLENKKHGKTVRYKDNYIMLEENYETGQRHGGCIARSAPDKLLYRRFYNYGNKTGFWTTWYHSGVKKDEGS